MKKQIESIVLQNKVGQILRIYKVENSDTFCIGQEDADHFEFTVEEAEEIVIAINTVVNGGER